MAVAVDSQAASKIDVGSMPTDRINNAYHDSMQSVSIRPELLLVLNLADSERCIDCPRSSSHVESSNLAPSRRLFSLLS